MPGFTGNILVLYGRGLVTGETFECRRAANARVNVYSWFREGPPDWDREIQFAVEDALASGLIRESYATVNSSRINGTRLCDDALGAPAGLRLPSVPNGYFATTIAALGATVHHNVDNLATSTRMLLLIDEEEDFFYLSEVLSDPNFSTRPLDVLWCACRSEN